MFSKFFEKWKYNKDQEKKLNVMKILQSFWNPTERQSFIVDLVLEEKFTSEELECVSNIIGKEAHRRNRIEKYGRDVSGNRK